MNSFTLRNAERADISAVLDLNAAFVNSLSPLDLPRLLQLWDLACYFKVADCDGEVMGFMLAFPEGSSYESLNYRWFADRYTQFVYIDRIVVADGAQGGGLGSAFYRDLEETVRPSQLRWITAEVDIVPPNEPSLEFHRRQGFVEAGQRTLETNGKVVSLLAKSLE